MFDWLIYLGEALLLQIRNDALTKKSRCADDVQHFFVIVLQKCKLEAVFCWVEGYGARSGRAIKTMDCLPLDSCEIDGVVESTDNTMVSDDIGLNTIDKPLPLNTHP